MRTWACKKFRPYIYGAKFELLIDHKSLEAIYNPRSRPPVLVLRDVCCDSSLMTLKLCISLGDKTSPTLYLACSHHTLTQPTAYGADEYVQFVTHASVLHALSLGKVEEATIQDDELIQKQAIQSGRFEKCKSYLPALGNFVSASSAGPARHQNFASNQASPSNFDPCA